MCEPTTIALVASAAFTVAAGVQQYQTAKAQGRIATQVAEQNQDLAQQNAADAIARGEAEASEQRLKTRLMIGSQRAQLAGQGVDLSMGTPVDILGDTAMFGKIDEDRIRNNAAREAWGYQVQGNDFGNEGTLAQWNSRQQQRATALGTAASLSQMGYSYYGGGGASRSGFGAGRAGRGTAGLSKTSTGTKSFIKG